MNKIVEVVEFKYSLFEVTMTTEEVAQMYSDVRFLEDALLTLLAEQKGIEIDTDFDVDTYKKYLHTYFNEMSIKDMELVRKLLT